MKRRKLTREEVLARLEKMDARTDEEWENVSEFESRLDTEALIEATKILRRENPAKANSLRKQAMLKLGIRGSFS